jgi:DNA polymerase III delta prime subunit
MGKLMHAYLIVGNTQDTVDKKILELTKKLKAKLLEFSVAKIEDVRNLSSFIKLSFNKPTAILIKEVQNASTAALNAFLKTLEEPQENVYFLLTTPSEHKLLPTVVSRCQTIRIKNQQLGIKDNKITDEFLKAPTGEKFIIVDKIRKREEAVTFLEELIVRLHKDLHNNDSNRGQLAQYLQMADKTLQAINMNGNVGLQLTNFVINAP